MAINNCCAVDSTTGALAEAMSLLCNESRDGFCTAVRMFDTTCPFNGRTCISITGRDWGHALKNGLAKRYRVRVRVTSQAELIVSAFSETQALRDAKRIATMNAQSYFADNAKYDTEIVNTAKYDTGIVEEK